MGNGLRKFAHTEKAFLIGCLFSVMFGAVGAVVFLRMTSAPTKSSQVQKALLKVATDAGAQRLHQKPLRVAFDTVLAQNLDLSTSTTIFTYGSIDAPAAQPPHSLKTYRFLAIFDAQSPNWIDKLVGRSGFYELTYFVTIATVSSDSLVQKLVKAINIDGDGSKEILIGVNSTRADSSSNGVIVLSKSADGNWHFASLPSLRPQLATALAINGDRRSAVWLRRSGAKADDIAIDAIEKCTIYEDVWEANDGTRTIPFVTLRNGGRIDLGTHPELDYPVYAVADVLADERSAAAPRHVLVSFLRFKNAQFEVDPTLNDGLPMISADEEPASSLNLKELIDQAATN